MVESKAWNWKIVKEDKEEYWKNPSVESYYLLNRWLSKGKKDILDLGCGLGRHTMLFAQNGFKMNAFDLSENALERAKRWAEELELTNIEFKYGDMLNLTYEDNFFDGIMCINVISHTDTEGMKQIAYELKRVLRKDGEAYFTLGSKESWGFKQIHWPLVDENTRIRKDDGPEDGIPHFYADYELIKELFKEFEIESIRQVEDFHESDGQLYSSYHYHVLIKKV